MKWSHAPIVKNNTIQGINSNHGSCGPIKIAADHYLIRY